MAPIHAESLHSLQLTRIIQCVSAVPARFRHVLLVSAAAIALAAVAFASIAAAQPAAPLAAVTLGARAPSDTASPGRQAASAHSLAPTLGQFPAQGDDVTTSLGVFRIFVNAPFRPLMAGYPGYNASAARLNSPILFDPMTRIGRSDPHLDGTVTDTAGTPVGTAGTLIADGNFSVVPAGFQGPAGTREVHTEVRSLWMTDTFGAGAHVRAGTAAPGQPISPGEVESKDSAGDPNLDFPAESFFDVFVVVDLPPFASFPGATLYNPYALLVANNNLTQFPPRVLYVHGNSTAVPILFQTSSPGNWQAGELFGWLVLAGHAMSYSNSQADIAEFVNLMLQQREMPLPCTALDFSDDAIVDLQDIIFVGTHWHDPLYHPLSDVGRAGPDNQNTIQDVQRMAGCEGSRAAGRFDVLRLPSGGDLFESPPGQSYVTVPVTDPIPAGFFGTKSGVPSDPLSGTLFLGGVPLISPTVTGSQAFRPVGQFNEVALLAGHGVMDIRERGAHPDTIVRRHSGAVFGDPATGQATETIPIEIVALSLQSVQPIQVTYGFTNSSSIFVAIVDLAPGGQVSGSMTLSRTHAFSGTFTSEFPVRTRLTFVNQVPGGTDQPQGPITRTDIFYMGMGKSSPLGSGYDTGPPTPWVVAPEPSCGCFVQQSPAGIASAVADSGVAVPRGAGPQAPPLVSVEPYSRTVHAGDTFTVSVAVSDVSNLGAFEFTIAYSPTLVEAITTTAGGFLGSTGRAVGLPPAAPIISNIQGTIIFGAYSLGPQAGPSGGGVLASVVLRAKAPGQSPLSLLDVAGNPLELVDPDGNLIAGVQSSGGLVQVGQKTYLPVILRQ